MKGYSLVELTISLFLASVVISTLMHYYFICQQEYFLAQKNLDEALEVQAASLLIQDSIRRAGFTPCLNIDDLSSYDPRSGTSVHSLESSEHTITIKRMSEKFIAAKIVDSKTIEVQSKKPFKSPLLIADCYHAEVFIPQSSFLSSKGLTINLNSSLHFDYVEPVYLGEFLDEGFFVAKARGGLTALYFKNSHKEKLTGLIRGMSVKTILSHSKKIIKLTLQDKDSKITSFYARVRA